MGETAWDGAGDESAFGEQVQRYRSELQVHCYRMLGSYQESEDMVQETFLRAWRRRETYAGRATFRAWLYRIATNACLDALEQRPRLPAPLRHDRPLPPVAVPWLSPYPDHLLDGVVARETIELAFLAAIQHLAPRQRAVLVLRDVLGWSAAEVAEQLDTSVAAVNSLLQRARPVLRAHLPERRTDWTHRVAPSAEEREVLRRYMSAIETSDDAALAALLREDVRASHQGGAGGHLGAEPAWYGGRETVVAAWAPVLHDPHGISMRMLPTEANRLPAAATYVRMPGDAAHRPFGLTVLEIEQGQVREVVTFSADLFPAFGLPRTAGLTRRSPRRAMSVRRGSRLTPAHHHLVGRRTADAAGEQDRDRVRRRRRARGRDRQAFAREGAVVHLAGRTAGKLDAVAERIAEAGGRARTAVVDALDEAAVERHADAVLAEAGSIDVSVNTVGVDNGDQGVPLVDLSPAQFTAPIEAYTRTAFLTSRAAARRMTGRGGVILTVSVPMARTPTALAGCFGAAFAAVENFTRQLAAEVGPHGVRVVGLRPTRYAGNRGARLAHGAGVGTGGRAPRPATRPASRGRGRGEPAAARAHRRGRGGDRRLRGLRPRGRADLDRRQRQWRRDQRLAPPHLEPAGCRSGKGVRVVLPDRQPGRARPQPVCRQRQLELLQVAEVEPGALHEVLDRDAVGARVEHGPGGAGGPR